MIEPQGPLPPEVYWRRRVVAGAGIVVAVVAVILLIIALSGGSGDTPKADNAAATDTPAAASTTPEAPKAPPNAPPSSEAPSGGGNHGAGGDPSEPAQPPAPSGAPNDPAAETGVPLCSDQALSVVLYTDKPTYTIGDQPVFTIVTTNGGLAPCTRDIGKAAQNVVVRTLDGARTLWSAQDCAPDRTVNVQVLQPGQQVRDDITWSGTTSSPGCKKKRVQIAPGGYQAIGKLGERESSPITFNVVAPAQAPGQ